MPLTFRRARRFAASILALLALLPAAAEARPAPHRAAHPATPAGPWLYRGSDIPHDAEWTFGVLPNGLRYAVRHNGVPPGQVSIRVRMDVGSLNETESERGFAHLLEHLVFRQSRYLAEGAAIPTWQRLGATFGSDTNAHTSAVSTTFAIDLPGATPTGLDESFKLLSGMMIAPTLSEANVRTDVPIVLAEKRERGGTAARVSEATQNTLFDGQRLAIRPVIGTEETLIGAHQDAVRAFHARWYRPENAVIVAAGDADPAALAALITKYFGGWKGVGRAVPAPPFGDPAAPRGANPANPVGAVRVLVEPELPRAVTYAVMRPWRPVHDTVVYNQGQMVDALGLAVINRRLEARARAGGSYLSAQVNREKVLRSADVTFVSITPLTADWKKALSDVRGVIADAMVRAPSREEIAREVAEMNVAYVNSVEQRRLQNDSQLADDIVTALDIRETVASPETVLAIFQQSQAQFTPENVLIHTRQLFRGAAVRAVYVTPQAGEADAAALAAALRAPVIAAGGTRTVDKPVSFAALPALGTPGRVTEVHKIGSTQIEQLDFANGVKVLLWPSDDEPGRVTVKVRFGAGTRAFAPGDVAYAALGEMALVGSGEGSLGQDELDRITTGRKIGFDFSIGDASFQISAETRAADLADQLYLLAAKFAQPRWDTAPFLRARAAAGLQYASFAASPQGVLERDLHFYERGRDPRFHTPAPAELAAATPEGFRAVWEPLLREGPIEIQLFGDVKRDAAVLALAQTFGALPVRPAVPAAVLASPVAIPASSPEPIVLSHRGDPGQAAALIAWPTGGGMAAIRESRQLEILSQLLQLRLNDSIREKLGAAYAPQVANSWPTDLASGGEILAVAQIAPKAVPVFYTTATGIAADLVSHPVSDDELARVIEPLKQRLERAYTSSAFFMEQLEGATSDPSKFAALGSLTDDFTKTTPAALQALAAKYLKPEASWRLVVLPEGQTLADVGAAPAAPTGTR